jgi:uncharacterized protein (DUF433 family)
MPRRQAGNQPVGGRESGTGNVHLSPSTGNVVVQGGEVIIHNSEILEGKPYLAGTRTGVHAVVGYWQTYGGDVERILREFPHLSRAQLDAALAFCGEDESQRAEIDEILRRNRNGYEEGLAHQLAIRGG